jgi:hypothetical protein
MMPAAGLEQQLWGYEYGRVSPERLTLELQSAIDTTADRAGALPYSPDVALWNPQLMKDYEEAMAAAREAVVRARFREALRQVRKTSTVLDTIHQLLDANLAVDHAQAAANQLFELAGSARLRRLPAVASLGQLAETARQWIAEARYREAGHLAAHCCRIAAALLEQCDPDAMQRDSIPERLDAIEELSQVTAIFAGDEDDLVRDGSVASLRLLFQRRFIGFGSRLLSELQIQLAGRHRFRLQCDRARSIGSPMFDSVEEARARIALLSWDGAVDYQWHAAVERYAGALQQQLQRLTEITEESWKI